MSARAVVSTRAGASVSTGTPSVGAVPSVSTGPGVGAVPSVSTWPGVGAVPSVTAAPTPGSLVLLRHGESVGNVRQMFTGVLDVALTETGEAECAAAATRLLQTDWRPDVVVTSELYRGWRTTEIVAGILDPTGQVPVRRTWRLNERSYGALSGHLKADVRERFGTETYLYWHRSYEGRPPALDVRTLELWARLSPFDRLPAEALVPTESLADVVARLRPWVSGELAALVGTGRHVLVVAHGNSLRALCGLLDGLGPEELSRLNLPNARPLRYDFPATRGDTSQAAGPATSSVPGSTPDLAAGHAVPAGAVPAGLQALRPLVRGGVYLDPDAARAEALVIAREGGT